MKDGLVLRALLVVLFISAFGLGYWAMQPRCPARSAPLFFAYYGGWACVATVGRLP